MLFELIVLEFSFFSTKQGCTGVVLKKKWGTPETRLRQKLSYTVFQ